MILTTTRRVRAYLGGAPAANQPVWNCSWVDISTAYVTTPDSAGGSLSGSTPVEIVGVAPASSKRQLQHIAIFNLDTSSVVVTVEVYDGSNQRKWYRASLDPNWSLEWEHGATWHVYDADGVQQGTGGGGGTPLTVEEVDGSPTISNVGVIQFDQGDGFVVSEPVAGTARIKATGTPAPDYDARILALLALMEF